MNETCQMPSLASEPPYQQTDPRVNLRFQREMQHIFSSTDLRAYVKLKQVILIGRNQGGVLP